MNQEFIVASIDNYHFNDSRIKKLTVFLPDREKIISDMKREDLSQETDSGKKPLIWAAGGGTYILGGRYIPLIQRSADSLTNPDKLTIATGLSNTYEEMVDPLLLIRELFEEIIIMDREKNLYIPLFSDTDIPEHKELNRIARESITASASAVGLSWSNLRFVKARLEHRLLLDEIEVFYDHSRKTRSGLIHLDALSGRVNILYAVHIIELNELTHLYFYDTETKINSVGSFIPLSREVFLLDFEKNTLLNAKTKEPVRDRVIFKTPHAEQMIVHLKKILKENYG